MSLAWFWITRATTEGTRWLDELLAAPGGEGTAPAAVYFFRGMLAVLQADATTAKPLLQRAASAAREAGQLQLLSESLAMASTVEHMLGDSASAGCLLDEAELIARGLDDHRASVAVLQARALHSLFDGHADTARAAAAEGVQRGRERGDLYTREVMLINMGAAALAGRDFDEARARYSEGLRLARQIDDRAAQFYLVAGLASCAAGAGDWRLAAQLFGVAETLRSEVGMTAHAILGHLVTQPRDAVIADSGASRFDAEFSVGARYHRADGVALALGETGSAPTAVESRVGLLGQREFDVARLVADGLTNKQIGVQLMISDRTVETHVRSIMNKLGVSSRAQIATWFSALQE